jgi:MFS transporter, DHA3 family, macrolide efflux protein
MNAGPGALLRLPGGRRYLAAAALAAVGSGMYFVAVAWYLFQSQGSTMAVGWAFIAATLPGLLLSPVVGVLLDRWRPLRICVGADVARGLLLLALAAVMSAGLLQAWHVYVAGFLVALCDNFFQPAVAALVRDMVTKERVLQANIAGSMAVQIGTLAGAGLGGFAIALFGTELVVAFNGLAFLVSALLIGAIGGLVATPPAAADSGPSTGVISSFGRALRETPARAFLLVIVVQQVLAYLTVFICNTLLPGFVARELQAGAEAFGLIDAGWGLGALAGGLLLNRLLKSLPAARVGAGCLLVFGAALVGLAAAGNAWQAAAAYVLLGCLGVALRVNADTQIVRLCDPAHFGKIKSGVVMLVSWTSLVTYAAVGWAGDHFSIRTLYAATATVVLSTALAMLVGRRRAAWRSALS